jgi:hypothetical protein
LSLFYFTVIHGTHLLFCLCRSSAKKDTWAHECWETYKGKCCKSPTGKAFNLLSCSY